MSIITLDVAKAHLRDVYGAEDELIQLYLDTAEEAAAEYIGRSLFADQTALEAAVQAGTAGDAPIVMTPSIRSACLLMLGHLYANREDVVAAQGIMVAIELPLGSRALLQPFRVKLGA